MAGQTNACVTVDVEWALNHLDHPQVRLVEVDWDIETYTNGHAPGAVGWTWATEDVRSARGYAVEKASFEALMSQSGIDNQTTVVLYGERDNLWATFASRLLMAYGHADIMLVKGRGKQWLSDHKLVSTKKPLLSARYYEAEEPNWSARPQQVWSTALFLLGLPDVTPGTNKRTKPIVQRDTSPADDYLHADAGISTEVLEGRPHLQSGSV